MASGHGLRSVLAGRDSWFGTGRIRWAGRRRCVAEFLHGLTILRAEEDFAFAGFGIHAAYLELGRVLILIFLSCLSFLSHRLCRLFRALGLDALELLVGLEIGALQAALELRHTARKWQPALRRMVSRHSTWLRKLRRAPVSTGRWRPGRPGAAQPGFGAGIGSGGRRGVGQTRPALRRESRPFARAGRGVAHSWKRWPCPGVFSDPRTCVHCGGLPRFVSLLP